MSQYKDNLTAAMTMLAQHPKAVFIGQSVRFGGQAMFASFAGVPMDMRIEMPVAEDFQMGMCAGLALAGFLPVCIFPRMDFMLLALNQLVNHLDNMQPMPKVIIRTAVGSKWPLNAGSQHTQNYVEAFCAMLKNVQLLTCHSAAEIIPAYEIALNEPGSFVIVEFAEEY
jgi:pyruvate/2-oxoglutarate/acetoin dehydrogenase E1 component